MQHPESNLYLHKLNSLHGFLALTIVPLTFLKLRIQHLSSIQSGGEVQQLLPKCQTVFLILAAFVPGQSVTAGTLNHEDLLGRYDTTISKLERTIGTAKAHRTALIERMDALGNNLKNVETAADKTNVKNPAQESELKQLQLDLEEIESLLHTKRSELQQQQNNAAELPVPGVLADALADTTALEHHRALALWQYRIHLKKRKIAAISNQKDELLTEIQTTNSRNNAVRQSMQKLTEQQKLLVKRRQSLEEKFTLLSADIVRQQDRIERMRKRRHTLQETPVNSMKFSKFQGSLPDPTEGTLYKRYAEPKAEGLLKWEGILVKAPLGQEIEAIFDGEVVFVGEIQGLGNVAIIEHDMDFMSLYGMAELLVVEEQQTVIAGQVIGTVGESVGNDASALYFEVRHNAETVNPEDWLSMQLISSDLTE